MLSIKRLCTGLAWNNWKVAVRETLFSRTGPIAGVTFFMLFGMSCFQAQASDLAGQDDPEFTNLVHLWLNNDDQGSLPGLARLARQGNRAARLFLARIERTERAPSTYLETLSRDQALDLFRSPSSQGSFRKSWLVVETARNNQLAAALLNTATATVDLSTIGFLIDVGERQATDHLVRIASLYGDQAVHRQLLDGLALEELHPFVQSQNREARKVANGLAALEYTIKHGENKDPKPIITEPDTHAAASFLALGLPYGIVDTENR